MALHKGGCHCCAVRFEFDAPVSLSMTECDCSLCAMTGFQHIFVPIGDFRILQGEETLTVYTFNTHTARHMFCSVCGIKAFYRPRSHPESYSVNYRCIDTGTLEIAEVIAFSGQNWETNIQGLKDKT